MRSMRVSKLSVGLVVVGALAAQTLGSAIPAQASSSVADRIAAVSDRAFDTSSRGLKAATAKSLATDVTGNPGASRLSAVAATAGWYVDGARFDEHADGRQAYLDDMQLVSHLDSSVRSDSDVARVDRMAQGLTDVLLADRQTAEIAVTDAHTALKIPEPPEDASAEPLAEQPILDELARNVDPIDTDPVVDPNGRAAAQDDVAAADKALAKAHSALLKGLPVAADTHFAQAWQHAVNVLANVGVSYSGDHDADGISDRAELAVGGSPLLRDTDGDGLRDAFEFNALAVLSLSDRDSDDDGVADGAEDHDKDGLTNAQEQAAGTSPIDRDTDGDKLTDPHEANHSANANKRDTDSDGLNDGDEVRASLDPTRADTDGDGIGDADEQLTVHVDGPSGAAAQVMGPGRSALDTRIAKVESSERTQVQAQAGPAMQFESPGGMTEADITLPYEAPALTNAQAADRMRVFWLDESKGAWVPVGSAQHVDTTRGVVTTRVEHFSTYAVFDISNWNQIWTAKDNPCRSRGDGGADVLFLDLALSIDSSGSMSWNDPQGLRKSAAKNFVDALLAEDRAGVVDFDSSARVLQGLTTDKSAVKAAIDRIDDLGGTNIGAGVGTANDVLIGNNDPDRGRVMILLTDGDGSWNPDVLTEAKQNRITIYTIGLGDEVNTSLLRNIATETGGQYNQVSSADQLPDVFRRISNETGADEGVNADSDNDGVNDCVETKGAYSPATMQRYPTDPNDPDTDNDGLDDGVEMHKLEGIDGIPATPDLYFLHSDPTRADTDLDQLDDPTELDEGSSAWEINVDDDGLTDADEVEWHTDTEKFDTDGDGFSDGDEVQALAAGFNPLVFDDPMTPDEWASEFAKGLVEGDAGDGTTIPYLLGTIASSAVSFIPFYGWIAGAILDLRDAIGNVIKGEWVGAGLSVAGMVPYGGDVANIAGKVTRFLSRNADKVDEVLAAVAKLDDLPVSVRADVLAKVTSTIDDLRSAGLSDATILRLARSRHGVQQLADTMRRSGASTGAKIDFVAGWRAAEDHVAAAVGSVGKRPSYKRVPGYPYGRYVDFVDADSVIHEVKSGYVKYSSRIRRQIEKDSTLVSDPTVRDVKGATWHLVASGRSDSLGADPRVLDLLDEKGIKYVIHLPS